MAEAARHQFTREKEIKTGQAFQAPEVPEELFGNPRGVICTAAARPGGLPSGRDVNIPLIRRRGMPNQIRRKLTRRRMHLSGRPGCKTSKKAAGFNREDIFSGAFRRGINTWLRKETEAGPIPQAAASPDAVLLLWPNRSRRLSLKEPEAAAATAPVPMTDVHRIDFRYERNALLTLARMWFTAAKDVAAERAFPGSYGASWKSPKNLSGSAAEAASPAAAMRRVLTA